MRKPGEGQEFAIAGLDTNHREVAVALGIEPRNHALRRTWLVVIRRRRIRDGFVEDAEDRDRISLEAAVNEGVFSHHCLLNAGADVVSANAYRAGLGVGLLKMPLVKNHRQAISGSQAPGLIGYGDIHLV